MSLCLVQSGTLNRRKHWVITQACLFAVVCFGQTVHAEPMPIDWSSAPARGAGDATTATVTKDAIPFTNPAGIGKMRNPRSRKGLHWLNFPAVSFGGNDVTMNAMGSKPSQFKELIPNLNSQVKGDKNTAGYIEAQAFPAVTLGGKSSSTFLFGATGRQVTNLEWETNSAKALTLVHKSSSTYGLVFGLGDMTIKRGMAWGVTFRPNSRKAIREELTAVDNLSFERIKEAERGNGTRSTGFNSDIGLLLSGAYQWVPTLGLAIRNIPTGCVPDYLHPITNQKVSVCGALRIGAQTSSINEARLDPTELRAGVSLTPRLSMGKFKVNMRMSADVFPLPVTTSIGTIGIGDIEANQLIHAGIELSFGSPNSNGGLKLRGGWNESNPTYGGSVTLFGFTLDYANYSVRVQPEKYQQRTLIGVTSNW